MAEITPIRTPDSPLSRPSAAHRGQGLVEYALILMLVAIIMIIVLISLGGQTKNMFSNVTVALGL